MKVNKLMNALLVFLILIVCIGAVSAEETVQGSDATSDAAVDDAVVEEVSSVATIDDAPSDIQDNLANSQSSVSGDLSSDNSEAILEEGDTMSYDELQDQMIYTNEINLDKDVKYDPSVDTYPYIGISKRMTINANGHTFDGNNLAQIFHISMGTSGFTFTLNDAKIINGFTNGTMSSGGATTGGAISIFSENRPYKIFLNNVTFINNHDVNTDVGVEKGGAIYMSAPRATLTLNNCSFENNSASGYGGAIAAIRGEVKISDSRFKNNYLEYEGHGGAIYSQNSKLTVNNSEFYNNKAGFDDNGYGGAISGSNMEVYDSKFVDNTAYSGGAIGTNDRGVVNIKVINSTFENNKAKLNGGAIHVQHSDLVPKSVVLNVENSSFKNNDGGRYGGGAICSPDATVKNSNFTNNKVFLYGGAISATDLKVDNCIFEDNSAKRAGAIFALNLSIEKSKFDGNEAADDSIIVTHKDYVSDDETVLPKVVTYSKIYDPWDYSYEAYQDYNYFLHCIEHELYDFYIDSFCTTDPAYFINYVDNSEVIEQLKIMYYLCHIDENFLDGGFRNYWGQYNISATVADLCMEDLSNPQDEDIKRIMDLYNSGFRVPDEQFILPNGTLVKYRFYFFINPEDVQNFLWYHYTTEDINETVSKETLNKSVEIGQDVQFRITVTNNGNTTLKGVFVNDSDFDEGLVYQSYINETGKWNFNETSMIWTLTTDLEAGKSASFIVIFKTTKVGELVNNVTAGFENYTMANSTNTTTVTNVSNETPEDNDTFEEDDIPDEDVPDEDIPDEDVPDEDVPDEEDVPEKKVVKSSVSKSATGNPLFALILVLTILGISPIRRKK